jgi:hypothetical protein
MLTLVLSIINIVLAAPAAVRERPEARLDANVTRNLTTASRKRWGSLDGTRNVNLPRAEPDPPSPDMLSRFLNIPWWQIVEQVSNQLEEQRRHTHRPPPPPDIPGTLAPDALSSTDDHHVPLSPGWPTESRFSVGSMPVAGSLPPPPPPPSHPSQPGPSVVRPESPGFSANPDTVSSTGSNEIPELDPEIHSLLDPGVIPSELEFWDEFLKGRIKRRMSGSDAVNLVQKARSRISS